MGGTEKVEKILSYIIDNRHRVAGADPARGPNLWTTWYGENGYIKGDFEDRKGKRGKNNSDWCQGLL